MTVDPLVCIISAGRPDNVPRMTQLVGPATWYVPPHEVGDYRLAGAVSVRGSGGLVASRNLALEDAFGLGRPCVQLSDDLRKLQERTRAGGQPCTWARALAMLRATCEATGAHLAGAAPTANLMYANPDRPVSSDAFIVGDLLYVQPSDPRFDPQLPLKEDYDFTCQHLAAYGAAGRANLLLATFLHRRNRGGAVAYRTTQLEDEAIARLQAKWPGAIRPNPRRPHEVLLRWRQRETA